MKNYFILTLALFLIFSSCKKEEFPLEFNLRCSITNPLGVLIEWDQVDENRRHEVIDRREVGTNNWEPIVSLNNDEREYLDTDMLSFLDTWEGEIKMYEYRLRSYPENLSGIPAEDDNDGLMYSETVIGYVGCEPGCWFELLASQTGGEYYQSDSPGNLVDIIIEVIESHAEEEADIMFLIDKTGSMLDDIDAVKDGLADIIDILPSNCRLGMAAFGNLVCDSIESNLTWYDFQDLTLNHDYIEDLVNDISPSNGCGPEESVFDGIYRTVNDATWESNNKLILVIGDEPPILAPCPDPLNSSNCFPVSSGCSLYSASEVIQICNSTRVVANLYPILVY